MKISNETKVGLLAVIAIAVLFIGYSFLKGNDVFSADNTYYTSYENVDGLTVSKPVLVNGYQIGRVSKMILQPDGHIRTEFRINGDVPIPKNSIARIASTDLLGTKAIVFEIGDSKEIAENGFRLESGVQANIMDKVEPIQKKIENITSKLDSVLTVVNSVLDEDFHRDFKSSVHSISTSLKNVEVITKDVEGLVGSERKRLSNIMINLESITSNFKNNETQINKIMNNLESVTDQAAKLNFSETLNKANKAMSDFQLIVDRINKGEGSIGLLINDDKLYSNLSNASESLDNLIKDVKDRPSRYIKLSVFGRKDPK
ncbi:MCE family protein [Sphingobacteriaceae bacterium WQ 2009]|uniref:MCE family protein n=1 Tax=Rhinopithecimicrobium faecis TaxID=2820698 RepID=A0A8T4HD02_9SPHI|nr:MCE family protein [Sphingobacteriaceae bacterium WQ 2009]